MKLICIKECENKYNGILYKHNVGDVIHYYNYYPENCIFLKSQWELPYDFSNKGHAPIRFISKNFIDANKYEKYKLKALNEVNDLFENLMT